MLLPPEVHSEPPEVRDHLPFPSVSLIYVVIKHIDKRSELHVKDALTSLNEQLQFLDLIISAITGYDQ